MSGKPKDGPEGIEECCNRIVEKMLPVFHDEHMMDVLGACLSVATVAAREVHMGRAAYLALVAKLYDKELKRWTN